MKKKKGIRERKRKNGINISGPNREEKIQSPSLEREECPPREGREGGRGLGGPKSSPIREEEKMKAEKTREKEANEWEDKSFPTKQGKEKGPGDVGTRKMTEQGRGVQVPKLYLRRHVGRRGDQGGGKGQSPKGEKRKKRRGEKEAQNSGVGIGGRVGVANVENQIREKGEEGDQKTWKDGRGQETTV